MAYLGATASADYRHILESYPEETVIKRGLYWFRHSTDYIQKAGLSGKVRINKLSLILMLCSYFADIIRLKDFHHIEVTNWEKLFAYSCYWFLRFKPVQILEELDSKQVFINERIAVAILTSEFIFTDENLRKNSGFAKRFMDELLYHFEYRSYTPQSIELTLVALTRNPCSE
jgi:hypothetical protein